MTDYRKRNAEIARRVRDTWDTLEEIGADHGISRERVRQIAKELGVSRNGRPPSRTVAWRCEGCGATRDMIPSEARRRKYCSRRCAVDSGAVGAKRQYSDVYLLNALRGLATELGWTPGIADVNAREDLPSHTTYFNRFGSMRAAQEAAGLEPNQRGG